MVDAPYYPARTDGTSPEQSSLSKIEPDFVLHSRCILARVVIEMRLEVRRCASHPV
jgi:hypothetical protein